ncbi:kinase-like protein [Polyporus arcularius HHB13444]|uniref:Kinase-like protein n=1 Tax=Polyporus arcularius HHB13444 TaxID=1314778 RepID=A0A5C3NV98_9APHY|nr:kinase-like protein [Polyporus arcularius HHB13444]
MDGLTQAHLALAYFVLPQVRNSVVARSSFTIITCNEDGTIKRAVEYFLSMWGYVLPSTDGTLAFWHQHDPLLIELATYGRFPEDQSFMLESKARPKSEAGGEYQKASRIISNADLVLVAGCLRDVTIFSHDIIRLKERHGQVAVFADGAGANIEQLQSDYVLTDPLSVTFPQVFAINPRSCWFNDGTLRTFYPGLTVIASPDGGSSASYADEMNTVPRHSRAFAVDCGPFIPRPALSRAEIMAMPEGEIARLCKTSPNLTDTPAHRLMPVRPVYVLAANVVVKLGVFGTRDAPEAAAMTVVRQQTSIPVPEVYRFFEHESNSYLVMEYVQGESLDHCWDDLSYWERVRVSVVLRNYVAQMRRIRTPQIERQIPGPIVDDLSCPRQCETPSLGEDRAGPFPSYAHLRDWMDGRLRVSQQMSRFRYTGRTFDDSEPLVFTHGDLFLRNMILGDDGRLWLIDFGCAGVYPRWFEGYSMKERTLLWPQPKLWTWTRKFATGQYDEQEHYLDACQYAMSIGSLWPDPGPEELERFLASRSV